MNQQSHTESSSSSTVAPDVISRRAYELWENEGRPEGCDMRHWLQAEQELGQSRDGAESSAQAGAPARNSDITPLQGTRAAAAVNSSRDMKRTPAVAEKNGNGSAQGARRKTAGTPAL